MSGECSQCGSCCKILNLPVKGLPKQYIHYLRTRGLKEDQGFFIIPHVCQHLTADNLCDIHESKDRPIDCVIFHGQKRARGGMLYYISPGCTMRSNYDK